MLRRADQPGRILADAALHLTAPVCQGAGFRLETLLQQLIGPGLENLPEDVLALFGGGQQQFEELPLGDHGDAAELIPVQADDPGDLRGDLPGAGADPAVRVIEFRFGPLQGHAAAPAGRALILRITAHPVNLPAIGKGKFHLGGGIRRGILAAQHGGVPVAAAGLPVQGVGDGVEQGGFSRAGIAGDQVQSPAAQLFHIQFGAPGIGAKGADDKAQRSGHPPVRHRGRPL